MAHLRFTRDRRGYENTFLVHGGRSSRDRPSILYWFRTPPDIRVGRSALDEEAVQALEAEHPEIRFDWARLREASAESIARGADASRSGPDAARPEHSRRQQRGRRRPSDQPAAAERPPAAQRHTDERRLEDSTPSIRSRPAVEQAPSPPAAPLADSGGGTPSGEDLDRTEADSSSRTSD